MRFHDKSPAVAYSFRYYLANNNNHAVRLNSNRKGCLLIKNFPLVKLSS